MPSATARMTVRLDDPIGTINPNIYGHFAEHLGRCVDEGMWVGAKSKIPNVGGIRKDVVAALKDLAAPVVRWPGGCFADDYHWQDGIGPRSKRPRTLNLWWGKEEKNEFGTDEFVDFCQLAGAEPYICANVGSGSPAEARNWLEYCNYKGRTHYAKLRKKHGHAKPFNVKYWGVGNENWGCGGRFSPDDYAKEYRRFACYLRGFQRAGGKPIELIACGHTTPDWNHDFMQTLGDVNLMDHLSIHSYFRAGNDVDFTDNEYYNALARCLHMDDQIRRAAEVLDLFARGKKPVGIIVDEWGMWHTQATVDTGLFQQNTLRDAIVAATALDLFNRWANRVTMANIAQTINVLQCVVQTDGPKMWLTPTYHVYEMYKPHMGATSLRTEVDCDTIEARGADGKPHALPALSASASSNPDAKTLTVTLTNCDLEREIECTINVTGCTLDTAEARILTSKDVRDHNDAVGKKRVRPRPHTATAAGSEVVCLCPAHSVIAITAKAQPGATTAAAPQNS